MPGGVGRPFVLLLVYILFLFILSGEGILRATRSISDQVNSAEASYRLKDDALETVRLDIYKMAVAARDGLLNRRPREARNDVVGYEHEIEAQIQILAHDADPEASANIQEIDQDVQAYLEALHSVVDQEYSAESSRKLANALVRRQNILDISGRLSKWNDANFEAERKANASSLKSLRTEIVTILGMILLLGTAAGGAAFYRISAIQKSNQEAHVRIAEAGDELKTLSHQLVSAQEAERKALSRELHDEIGQSLTALKLELANSEKIARAEGSGVVSHLQAIRTIADQTLRAAKNISLGLRPPMLDDLGLVSALNWFISEFSQRTGIAVELAADGSLGLLGEAHRICVYRVVQEGLTNCSRHSRAQHVYVRLDANEDCLTLTITDNGVGFETRPRMGTGLGLVSMQERALELGGTFEILSSPGNGTTIYVVIPMTPVSVA